MLISLPNSLKRLLVPYYLSIREYIKSELPSKFFHVLPDTINFPITSKCNSKCIMCNVWKSSENDLDAREIGRILRNSLFKKIVRVGISGGEPTLREDIVECVHEIINSLPKLKSISFISNGLDPDKLLEVCQPIYNLCKAKSISFAVSISLDGIGKDHDRIRGVNAFDSVDRSIQLMKSVDFKDSLSIGTTITRFNADKLKNILDYCDNLCLPVFFQIATEHERLHNIGFSSTFNLSERQKKEVCVFLSGIVTRYPRGSMSHTKLNNLLGMLGEGKERLHKCLMQSRGITLTGNGELSYCAVRGKTLGNAAEISAKKLFFKNKNLAYRRKLTRTYCSECFHNYTGRIKVSTLLEYTRETFSSRFFYPLSYFSLLRAHLSTVIPEGRISEPKRIFITGWYGTETIGDRAILKGIIALYQEKYPSIKFFIHSIRPYLTYLTLMDENLIDIVSVVPNRSKEIRKAIKSSDHIVIGGGPLFQTSRLLHLLKMFSYARMKRKRTIVFGCGIGPFRNSHYRKLARGICETSGTAILRDKNSLSLLRESGFKKKTYILHDPAVYGIQSANDIRRDKRTVLFCLRKWPVSCSGNLSAEQFLRLGNRFDEKVVRLLDLLITKGKKPILLPMHRFHHGGDDREYYTELLNKMEKPEAVELISENLSTEGTVKVFRMAGSAVCMRYHSIVFASRLGLPFLAIDYSSFGHTGKGKAFLEISDPERKSYSMKEFAEADEKELFEEILQGTDRQYKTGNHLIKTLTEHRNKYLGLL